MSGQQGGAPLPIVIAGHVDHGKSTLVGRLLHETGALPEGKYEAIRAMCEKRGMPLEWAFLLDAFQAERDQAITIDTTQIRFSTAKRDYLLIDAPGHKEFLKNMITGAAQAQAALLLVDVMEGMREQSRRHAYLLHLLGVRQIVVVVNKMDAADYKQSAFDKVALAAKTFLEEINLTPAATIPISAREGDFIAKPSKRMAWYKSLSVLEALDEFVPEPPADHLPLRLPVQDVYKFDERRIVAGRIESGNLKAGDELLFSPSGKQVKVKQVEHWGAGKVSANAGAGRSVGLTLADEIFVERGEVISHAEQPPLLSDVFRAHIFWLGKRPLKTGDRLKLKLATMETEVRVQKVEQILSTEDLSRRKAAMIQRNEVGELVFRARRILALDAFRDNPRLGRFVLVDGYDIAGGGIVSTPDDVGMGAGELASENITRMAHRVTLDERQQRNSHKGGVLLMTGLSGAGKSTLALMVEQRLFERGYAVYVLDGDNIRHGLNADLAFSPEDRAENIRRIGEVAALFARAGMVAIAAFISPHRIDRARARAAADNFHEVYIKADIKACEERDPKGLYKKVRAGEIKEFTGISAPYEAPENPELVIDTCALTIEESVQKLADYVVEHFSLDATKR